MGQADVRLASIGRENESSCMEPRDSVYTAAQGFHKSKVTRGAQVLIHSRGPQLSTRIGITGGTRSTRDSRSICLRRMSHEVQSRPREVTLLHMRKPHSRNTIKRRPLTSSTTAPRSHAVTPSTVTEIILPQAAQVSVSREDFQTATGDRTIPGGRAQEQAPKMTFPKDQGWKEGNRSTSEKPIPQPGD